VVLLLLYVCRPQLRRACISEFTCICRLNEVLLQSLRHPSAGRKPLMASPLFCFCRLLYSATYVCAFSTHLKEQLSTPKGVGVATRTLCRWLPCAYSTTEEVLANCATAASLGVKYRNNQKLNVYF
jgi:hypothetical protein